MTEVKGKHFSNENVLLDNTHFLYCKFVACRFIYSGDVYRLQHCEIRNCQVVTRGAAARTAKLLLEFGWKAVPEQKAPETVN
jgi:hypothetical protein